MQHTGFTPCRNFRYSASSRHVICHTVHQHLRSRYLSQGVTHCHTTSHTVYRCHTSIRAYIYIYIHIRDYVTRSSGETIWQAHIFCRYMWSDRRMFSKVCISYIERPVICQQRQRYKYRLNVLSLQLPSLSRLE